MLVSLFGCEVTLVRCWQFVFLKTAVQKAILAKEVVALRFEGVEQTASEHHEKHAKIAVNKVFLQTSFAFFKMFSEHILQMRKKNSCTFPYHLFAIFCHIFGHNQFQFIFLLVTILVVSIDDLVLGDFDFNFIEDFHNHWLDDFFDVGRDRFLS